MTYHDEPYWECNGCDARLEEDSFYGHGWVSPGYDTHYCPQCRKEIKESEREAEEWRENEIKKLKSKEHKES